MPRVRKKLNANALSTGEWNYLHGLFLADGYRDAYEYRRNCWSYRIRFFLQGDQLEIAHRIATLIKKTGLKPHVGWDPIKNMIIVRVYSILLFDFLPDGKRLRDDPIYREHFYENNGLLNLQKGMPFIAGLLDGDGRCQAWISKGRRSFLGSMNKWLWSFSQTKFLFLIDYILKFAESLAPDSVRVMINGRGRIVSFRKSLIIALLKLGIEEYSWKVTQWLNKVVMLERDRGIYHTVGEVARMFNVSSFVARNWIKAGKLSYLRRTDEKGKSYRYFVSTEEVERFREIFLKERNALERIKSDGVKLVDAAEMLGIPYSTLRRWHRFGKFRAVMVHEGSLRFLVVPRDEINQIKAKCAKRNEKGKRTNERR